MGISASLMVTTVVFIFFMVTCGSVVVESFFVFVGLDVQCLLCCAVLSAVSSFAIILLERTEQTDHNYFLQ